MSLLPDCTVHYCEQRRRAKELPISLLRDLFSYDSESGALTWLKPPKFHPRMKGKQAGSIVDGYLSVQISGYKLKAHRICFAMHFDRWPNGVIDHINRNPTDNRISNLRECSQAENMRNHSKGVNGSGLPVGVRKSLSGKYVARIGFNNKSITLGTFNTIEEASNSYRLARKKYFGEFA